MRILKTVATCLFLGALLASCDTALLSPEGAVVINGIVVDAETRAAIAGATVTFGSELDTTIVTGPDGSFVVSNVAIGSYVVTASAEGYRPGSRTITTDLDLFGPDTIALAPAIPGRNLLAYWPLNGNANDVSGRGLHGSPSGVLWTYDRFSAAASAAQFDGGSGAITVSRELSSGQLDEFTATAWVQFQATQPGKPAVISNLASAAGFELRLEGRTVAAEVRSTSGAVVATSLRGLNDGRWHMLALTVSRSSRRIEIYVDGDYIDGETGPGAEGPLVSSQPLLIGRSDVSGTTLAGAIDDVRLFGSRLAADEIRALFQERG